MYADEMETGQRRRPARYALQQVADALGDVDAYIVQIEPGSHKVPMVTKARSSRYGHAARHLAECAMLAQRIEEFGTEPGHDIYERSLRAVHGRKTAFWEEVSR